MRDGSVVLPARVKGTGPLAETEREVFRLLAARGDVTVNLKASNVVGFYAETTPHRDMTTRIADLQTILAEFRSNLQEVPTPNNKPMSFVLDFVFDFDRQTLFDADGVLASETALAALRGDEELRETREWLRVD